MTDAKVAVWYEQILQQMAAECYLEGLVEYSAEAVTPQLLAGNNRSEFDVLRGLTRFTLLQTESFVEKYIVRHQLSDNASIPRQEPIFLPDSSTLANSGFSATLIQKKGTNEYTLAIRSTEFQPWKDGGDRERDGYSDYEIFLNSGFPLAQLDALERYYDWLKTGDGAPLLPAGASLTVSGYSLGGALATAFTVLHPEVVQTYTFNGVGLGKWDEAKGGLRDILDYYRAVLANPDAAQLHLDDNDPRWQMYLNAQAADGAMDLRRIYQDPRYRWAVAATKERYNTGYDALSNPQRTTLDGVEQKIVSLYGHATHNDAEWAANSGRHGMPIPVFIEGQPGVEWNAGTALPFDFGNSHSIVLIADSLALMNALQQADPDLTLEQLNTIFAAASNQRNSKFFGDQVEADSLDRVLEAIGKIAGVPSNTAIDALRPLRETHGFGNVDARERFYLGLGDLSAALLGKEYTIRPLIQMDYGLDAAGQPLDTMPKAPVDIYAAALLPGDEGRAYRYALRELNSFVVLGADYEPFNENGELELYDPQSIPAGMSEDYLRDRADLMRRFLTVSVDNDLADGTDQSDRDAGQYGEPLKWKADAIYFEDRRRDFRLGQGGQFESAPRVIFGEETSDAISGGRFDDRIYGGDGSDLLDGAGGDDYMEGGTGIDVYNYVASGGLLGGNSGNDVILDADGLGVLRYAYTSGFLSTTTDVKVIGGAVFERPEGGWQSADGKFTYAMQGADMVVTIIGDAGGTLTLKNFENGDFGIQLQFARSAPENEIRTFLGDKADWDSRPEKDGLQTENDRFGNTIRNDGEEGRIDEIALDRADTFYGAAAADNEEFDTGGGDDWAYADGPDSIASPVGGDDIIELGPGKDIAAAGAGNDWVEGGAGPDILGGNDGDDTLYADTSEDHTLTLEQAIRAGDTGDGASGTGELLTGDAGNDVLFGSSTSDLLLGGIDEDVIVGAAGDDTIYGDLSLVHADRDWTIKREKIQSSKVTTFKVTFDNPTYGTSGAPDEGGADVIYGGAGSDWVFGGAGDDYVEGGSGDDVVLGEGGNDIVLGGAGKDRLDGDSMEAVAAGLAGNDFLDGGDDRDILHGEAGDDILFGGNGNDDLFGGDGNDVLYGGPGDDVLIGGAGKDTYIFYKGDGVEVIQDIPTDANDPDGSVVVVNGASRADVKFRLGSLAIDLGDGSGIHLNGFDADDPWSTPMIDAIRFDDGSVMTYQDVLDQGFDLDGTEDEDFIHGTAVTDRIDAKGGNDIVAGKAGDDDILGGAGDDILQGGDGADIVAGGAGNDHIEGGSDDDALYGDEGEDILAGEFGADVLDGGDGDDELDGGDGDDTMLGGAGEDRIAGSIGNDVLEGGLDDDRLSGQAGSDTYRFSRGDGRDVIAEQGLIARGIADQAGIDTIRFGAGIAKDDVQLLRRANGDLSIRYGANDEVTVRGQYSEPGNAIECIEFDSGAPIGADELASLGVAPIVGTAGDDVLFGTTDDDTLLGLEGDDVLDGGASPNGVIAGAAATGNDLLMGGAGADTYVVSVGMGMDTVIDASATLDEASTLELGAELTFDSVSTRREDSDLLVSLRGRPDGVRIKGYYDSSAAPQHWFIAMADGSVLTMDEWVGQALPAADSAAVAAMEDYQQQVISDWKAMAHGPLLPTYGHVRTSWSQTTVQHFSDPQLPPEVETLDPVRTSSVDGYGIKANGAIVSIVPSGRYTVDPTFVHRHSDDAVIEAVAAARMTTTAETHRVFVAAETGGEVQSATAATGPGTFQTTYSMVGEAWGPLRLDASNPNGTLTVQNVTSQPVLEKIVGGDSANVIHGVIGGDDAHVAVIDAGDGNDFIVAGPRDFVYGNDGDDTIVGGVIAYGGNGADDISEASRQYGGRGNDILSGGDYLDGGAGDDTMSGGDGPTTFYLDPLLAGEDYVEDDAGMTEEEFALWYYQSSGVTNAEEGIAFGGMWSVVGKSGGELRLKEYYGADIGGTRNPYYDDEYVNGYEWPSTVYETLEDLQAHLAAAGVPYDPADIRYIPALSPAPEVSAGDYAALEPLYESGMLTPDTLRFGPGVTFDEVRISRNIDDTELAISWGENHSVAVRLAQPDDLIGAGIERFEFADGSVYDISSMLDVAEAFGGTDGKDVLRYTDDADIASGLAGNDEIYAYGGDDFLSGGPGDDHLEGGAGDDVYLFERGGGADFVFDEGGDDVVRFGAGIAPDDVSVTTDPYDVLYLVVSGSDDRIGLGGWFDEWSQIEAVEFFGGTTWDAAELEARIADAAPTDFGDVLTGTPGDDLLDGGSGDDAMFGLDGNDILLGGAGDDDIEDAASGSNFVDGDDGDDYVYEEGATLVIGGPGNDTIDNYGDGSVIAFNRGDGHDTIYAASAFTLSLGAGITVSDLTLTRQGDDLILTVGAGESIRLTREYEDDARAWPQIMLQTIDGGGTTTYDFNAVVDEFYASVPDGDARSYPLAESLGAHVIDTTDDLVFGGEIAYQYARRGQVGTLSSSQIREVLDDPDFGVAAQPVEPIVDAALEGTTGNDVLTGTGQADTLVGGPGDDVLDGGLGDDTYVFNVGDGVDHIADAGGTDTLSFGPGIAPEDLSLGLGSLLIRIGEHDAVHVDDFDASDALGSRSIEVLAFADGATLTYEELLARGFDLDGTSGNDTIDGTSVVDRITGGRGNDLLRGGAGNDTYAFAPGDGQDEIIDTAGNDVVRLGSDIRPEDVRVAADEGRLAIALRDTGDSVSIRWAPDEGFAIERVDFGDGESWSAADLLDRINDAPTVLTAPVDVAAMEDEALQFSLPAATFTDPDAWGSLSYTATLADGSALPEWLAFDAQALAFSGVPDNSAVGAHRVRVTATDQDGLSASATFNVRVTNVNDAPQLVHPVVDQIATEDEPLSFMLAPDLFVDVDAGDVLTLTAVASDGAPLPTWLAFEPATRMFSGTPRNADVGTYALRVTAIDDSGATASDDFSLTVTNVNDAPVLVAPLPDRIAYQNAPMAFALAEGAFVDVDANDNLTLSAASRDGSPLPAWLSFDAGSGVFYGMADETETGSYGIAVSATDVAGARTTAMFDLFVSDAGAYDAVRQGTRRNDVIRTGAGNDVIDADKGDDDIDAGAGRDVVFGGKDDDRIALGYGNDIGFGGKGKDRIDGGPGQDLLIGGDGTDWLRGGSGNDVLIGGAGKDELHAGQGNNLLIGGPGGDLLHGGPGSDVFAFDRRDGKATVYAGDATATANRDTLSFGAGISASDIVLRRSGKDLIVKIDEAREEREDGNVSVVLADWYAADSHRSVTRLQLAGERTAVYDFTGLVARFDAATRGKSTPWRAAAALPALLLFESGDEAIGGVLAHEYAAHGDVSAVALSSLQGTLADPGFAVAPQSIANAEGDTLAAYFAHDARDESGEQPWLDLPKLESAWSRAGDDALRPPTTERHGHGGHDPVHESNLKPVDLRAILEAMERFAAYAGDARSGARQAHTTSPVAGAASGSALSTWALTNAMLAFHLSSAEDAALGSDIGAMYGQSGRNALMSVPVAQASIGVPDFAREAQALQSFAGLHEGLARLG